MIPPRQGKMRKVKSILKNDKPLTMIKEKKCVEKEEVALKVKSSRTAAGVRLQPHRKAPPTKIANETKLKTVDTKTKPASKTEVQQPKLGMVQTLLTSHAGKVSVRRSSRLQNESETSKNEHAITEETGTRKSSRNKEPNSKDVLLPTVVLQRIEADTVTAKCSGVAALYNKAVEETTVEVFLPIRRSSARLSMKKSLTGDKSIDSNSLYVSALEDV